MLCDCCHQRTATQHITTIVDGKTQVCRDLCEHCLGLPGGAPEVLTWAANMAKQRCEYCDAPATSGGSGPGRPRFWCQQCGQEYGRILQEVYSESPKPVDPAAISTWVENAMDEAERRFRAKRSGPG